MTNVHMYVCSCSCYVTSFDSNSLDYYPAKTAY